MMKMQETKNCLFILSVILFVWIESSDSCACSAELQNEVNKLRDRIEYLETKLYTNCKKCPEGYEMVGERCYRVSLESRSWMDAALNCTRDGAQLVSLQTQQEETRLRNYLQLQLADFPFRARFHTGLNELEEKGVWRWGVGEESELLGEYSNWTPGEPNDHQGELEQCMEFHLGQGWFDIPCSLEFMWICETEPGLQWMDGRGETIIENTGFDGQKYKPFWTRYSRRYGKSQEPTDENGDSNKESENEYNSDVYEAGTAQKDEAKDEPAAQETDDQTVNEDAEESDQQNEANNKEEDQMVQIVPGSFMVSMVANN